MGSVLERGEFGDPWYVDRQNKAYLAKRTPAQAERDRRMPRWTAKQKYWPPVGPRREIMVSGATKDEVRERLRAKRVLIQASIDADGDFTASSTFREVGDAWLAERRKIGDLKPQSLVKYQRLLEQHAYPRWGANSLHSIRTNTLHKQLQKIEAQISTRQLRTVLRQIWKWANATGITQDNPTLGLLAEQVPASRLRAKRQRREEPLAPEELDATRELMGKRDKGSPRGGPKPSGAYSRAFLVLEEVGPRIGEVLALRRRDCRDLRGDEPYLHFAGTLVEQTGVPFGRQEHTKSDNEFDEDPGRYVGISRDLAAALDEWIKDHDITDLDAPIFATRTGNWIRPSNVRTALRNALSDDRAPRGVYPHLFRKTVGTVVTESQGVEAAQAILGHASPQTTMKFYVRRGKKVVPSSGAMTSYREEATSETRAG